MTGRIVRTPLARQDVKAIAQHLKREGAALAQRFLRSAEKSLADLASMPTLGSEWESDAPVVQGLRVWPVHGFPNHLILYRIVRGGIRVIRVVHGAQDWQAFVSR